MGVRPRALVVDEGGDLIEFCYEQGWTDGLPVVPPTPEKVAVAVAATGREPGELVCSYVERQRDVLVEHVATNAVMAGCRPEYVPVVVAIVEAMASESFGMHPSNTTTRGAAIGFVVNGPIRTALGMNCRGNVFGPGNRANSTIGRAVRLVQINALGSVPGAGNEEFVGPGNRPILDQATMGQPGKYAGYHIAEDEEDFPTLRPLHVERGFSPEQSVVTVFATDGHMMISAHQESTAEQITDTLSHYLVHSGRFTQAASCVLVIPPENAEIFVRDGWTKEDIRQAVFNRTTRTVAWVKDNGWSLTLGLMDDPSVSPGDDKGDVAIARSPDDILVTIAGGPAGAFIHALLPYHGLASKEIRVSKETA